MKRTLIKLLLVLFSVLGLAVAAYLSWEHYQFKTDPEHKAICDISETVSCKQVTMSPWSEIPLPGESMPLPISIPGIGFFAAALFLVALGWAREERYGRRSSDLLIAMMVPALVFDVYLAYVSKVLIGAWCVFCVSLYVSHLALLALAWIDRGGNPFAGMWRGVVEAFRPGPAWVALSLFLALTAGAHLAYSRSLFGLQSDSISRFLTDVDAALKAAKPVDVEGGEHVLGTPGASLVLVEYADFQCPHCRFAAAELEKIVERYRQHIQFVFRNYPLDQACNPFMQRPLHQSACLAAQAVECADRNGRFWDMHRMLFATPEPEYSQEMVLSYGKDLGIDPLELSACLKDAAITESIRGQVVTGKDLGVSSTPTVFLNGVALEGGTAPLQAELVIRSQLKQRGIALPPPVLPQAAEVK